PDVVFTLGGDGTILRAITLIRETGIPILGFNLGRLGFLAIAEKERIEYDIDKLMQGRYTIQERSMLKLDINDDIFGDTPFALNDITFHKYAISSVVVIHTWVDDMYLNSYWADGLIISTPTGSTGYSLSCGGPIILPGSKNFVITPVAPHQLTVRPIIIPDTSVISFKIEGRSDDFLCTLDSRYHAINVEHTLKVRKCAFNASLVVLEGMDFVRNVYNKLLWGLDRRHLPPDLPGVPE
ncbi:MAG TPA: NAD kinase, partial [Saprospirales bacterium]|nr:NAD kinase [Saprospirales bacterium]